VRTIKEDIISWSKDFLELPNKELGNKPVCPYAKKARISGQINIVVEESGEKLLQTVVNQCNKFTESGKKICIVACPDLETTADELDNHIHALNHVYIPQDVYLMASHPGNDLEPVEFLENTDWESDNEFLMVLIQPFEELEKASSSLNKIGFYEAWPKEYYQSTVTKRKTYRRLLCEE
tara:strand:- start:153 stop:689 length:537 start_codon:yes stop_codon:yes gene_type:complete